MCSQLKSGNMILFFISDNICFTYAAKFTIHNYSLFLGMEIISDIRNSCSDYMTHLSDQVQIWVMWLGGPCCEDQVSSGHLRQSNYFARF